MNFEQIMISLAWNDVKDAIRKSSKTMGYRRIAEELGISVNTVRRIDKGLPVQGKTIAKCVNVYMSFLDNKEEYLKKLSKNQ